MIRRRGRARAETRWVLTAEETLRLSPEAYNDLGARAAGQGAGRRRVLAGLTIAATALAAYDVSLVARL